MTALSGATGGAPNLFTMRFKRIDPNEFAALASSYLQQQQAATGQTTTGTSQAGTGTGTGVMTEAQLMEMVNAPLYPVVRADTQAGAQAVTTPQAQVQTQTQTQAEAAPQVQTQTQARTTASTNTGAAVAIPSSNYAPRKANDYWYAHIAQYKGQYLTDGPSMRPNCGPASVTMALRLIGLDIPGFNGQRSEAVLDKARIIATGTNNTSVGTTDAELEKLITASGGKWSESQNLSEITGWVKQGIPVVLSGNPAKGWDSRYSSSQVYPFDGGHWVTVSGYDQKSGYYIVNDPLSQIGPIYVSEQELSNYTKAHGQLGIAVFR